MHLVLVHGYLLGGTGSNVYTANIAKSWKQQGHAVTVICQDPFADRLDFVDEFIVGTDKIPSSAPKAGTIRVVVPDINGLLLVYWYDLYEGYEVKTMVNCSIDEIEANIKGTADGLKKVIAQGVDRILANHAILSPVITKRATEGTGIPYDVKIHGSSIIFSVKNRQELRPYALEGIKNCRRLIVGAKYMAGFVQETFEAEKEEIAKKIVIISPGMDPEVFQLGGSISERQDAFLASVKDFIKRKPGGRREANIKLPDHTTRDLNKALESVVASYDLRAADADLCERWIPLEEDEPVICFFGKFQETKGVGELLMAFGTIVERFPRARLLLIGFGGNREHLEGMLAAMIQGSFEAFKAYAEAGNFVDLPQEAENISVLTAKALEAFGMVSVEAMASGVLPLCHDHTGISDVINAVQEVDPELGSIMRVEIRPGGVHGVADGAYIVEQLPNKVERALKFLYPNGFGDHSKRREVSAQLRAVAVEKFSWDVICKKILKG
ncbi:hypothetical protein OS493_012676 [Desmophyllum pertusum]|uniref:Glycosyl transferase family 1 domain-containing protein n=1 Tax=Desmophyllum pertusum TaxID=174260 RepID=A0A9X0CY79_9CNID|nr:hypothetical protein OS493_012676 [Desmophyllum pertusum]